MSADAVIEETSDPTLLGVFRDAPVRHHIGRLLRLDGGWWSAWALDERGRMVELGAAFPRERAAALVAAMALPRELTDGNGWRVVTWARCGACRARWNDSLVSDVTPTPAGRCPVEAHHDDEAQG